MSQLLTVTQHGRIGAIALNHPPVNALSHAVRTELLEALARLFADASVDAIVLWCEGRTFIAGADIRELGKPPLAPDLPELVEFIDGAPKAVIAAIHGSALGGGLELALACHFRVSTPIAQLGLPEVTLGILPGAGGTQRLPRRVGVRAALEMIVGGQLISAARARDLGLIDEFIEGDLKVGALAFAERVIADGRPLRRISELTLKLDDPNLIADYEKSIATTCRGFRAPFHCIRAIHAAVELPFSDGLKRERELFLVLMQSPESKAQRHAFFAERDVAKAPDLPNDTPTRPIKSAAVVGSGATAREIVTCFPKARIPVIWLLSTQEEIEQSLSAIREGYAVAVAEGRLKRAAADEQLGLIRPTLSYPDLKGADLLIEAAPDDLESKREILAKLDSVAKPSAIFATTTSYIDIASMVTGFTRPQDLVGMHFVSPVDAVKLLETVRTPATAADVFATVMKLGRTLGKVSVPVHGLLATRLHARLLREAFSLLEQGALREQVDRVLYDFGFPIGPFAALDRQGPTNDPKFEALLAQHSGQRGITRRKIADAVLLERCLYAIINAAAHALDEGVAARPIDVDMIWIHGYGFPLYRGGPMFYADQVGLQSVYAGILKYQKQADGQDWNPAPLIERLAAQGIGFYAASDLTR